MRNDLLQSLGSDADQLVLERYVSPQQHPRSGWPMSKQIEFAVAKLSCNLAPQVVRGPHL